MRRRLRIRAGSAVYHCMSRAVNKEHLSDRGAREKLRKEIWRIADFSGVDVITYCVMSNHFHVLVEVPDRREVEVSDEELVRRYEVLYPKPTSYQAMPAPYRLWRGILI